VDSVPKNLFARLHKWAWRQDENFLTESLDFLLDFLLEQEPTSGVRLLNNLTGGFLSLRPDEAKGVVIRTQVQTTAGRPDLEIRTVDSQVFIEVKAESEVRIGQLEGHRGLLNQGQASRKCLVLLSRYPVDDAALAERPDAHVRWYQVVAWLEFERNSANFRDVVGRFLIDQFVDFLRARNMAIAQVDWQMAGGIRSLRSLIDMLQEAAVAYGLRPEKQRDDLWNSIGYYLKGGRFWVGVSYANPEKLIFHTHNTNLKITASDPLQIGEAVESAKGYYWLPEAMLDSEDAHFFSRSRASQFQWLETFLKESADYAETLVKEPLQD
jgi:hypothetical protein